MEKRRRGTGGGGGRREGGESSRDERRGRNKGKRTGESGTGREGYIGRKRRGEGKSRVGIGKKMNWKRKMQENKDSWRIRKTGMYTE